MPGLRFAILILSLAVSALVPARPARGEPREYKRNERIRTEAALLGDEYRFTFGFNDPSGHYNEWSWNAQATELDRSAREFGLKGKAPDDIRANDDELREAYFRKDPRLGVVADFSALVARYGDSVAELHDRWKRHVEERALSKREAIETLLVFLQDFPYGRPGQFFEGRVIGDLFVPPLVFRNGWGDCDSKSLLMATVLSREEAFRGKLAMVLVPGHALLGIETDAGPYDEVIVHQNRRYVLAEPTGLGRTPFGRKNSPYSTVLLVDPIRAVSARAPRPSPSTPALADASVPSSAVREFPTRSDPAPGGPLRALTSQDCGKTGVLIESKKGSPPVRVQSCYVSKGKDVFKHGPQVEFDADGRPIRRTDFNMGR